MFGVKQHNMYQWQQFNNFGIITDKIPEELFNKLKAECEIAKQARYDKNIEKTEMISGLTGNGVPVHYYIEQCKEELDAYAMQKFYEYETQFKYLAQFKCIDRNMGFTTTDAWVNIQQKYEYIPAHNHDGIMAYVIWINIPYDIKEEVSFGNGTASCFNFQYSNILGQPMSKVIQVSKEDEGTIMIFPSALIHQVYPFYTSDGVRMSISGMVTFDGSNPLPKQELV
jgi:hypothetical protein